MQPDELLSRESIAASVRGGDYMLLLGAGGSLGAKGGAGEPLKGAEGFGQLLIETLGLKITPGTPLPYIWEAACAKAGSEATLRSQLVTPSFMGCSPAPYHLLIPSFPWARIYTFNVDDVLQQAYSKAVAQIQDAIYLHFDADYREPEAAGDEVQVVYLHGGVLFPDQPLVFGPPAYASTSTRQHTWWHVFSDSFVSRPVMVVGASLREPDFEAYLSMKRRPSQPFLSPSLYVNPVIDDAVRATCERLGLTPVEMRGDEFFQLLDGSVPQRERLSVQRARRLGSPAIVAALRSKSSAAALARQCVYVNATHDWPVSSRSPEKFYEGHDPTWDDIKSLRDVEMPFERDVLARISTFGQPTTPQRVGVTCLYGTAGCGKTTALMRIAARAAESGRETLFFTGLERLRHELIAEMVAGLGSEQVVLLFIDDIGDHINQVRRLISGFPAAGARLMIVAATRAVRRQYVERNLKELLPTAQYVPVPRLAYPEGLELAVRLRKAAKLGRFAGKTEEELARKFIGTRDQDWAGQLLVLLLEVVPGGRFVDRLKSEWDALKDPSAKAAYGVICLAAACGVSVRSAVVFRAVSGGSVGLLQDLTSGPLGEMVEWHDKEYLRPLHRVIGEQTIRTCVERAELFPIALRLGKALGPYVSRDSIRKKTVEVTLAAKLMNADGMVMSRLDEFSEDWMEQMAESWGWNSRYWEQRALIALKYRHFARARDYAEQAVGLERHPLPMTTCAFVRLRSANEDLELNRDEQVRLYEDGRQLLLDAIKEASRRGLIEIHPYGILFTLCVKVSRRLFSEIPRQLREDLRAHVDDVRRLFAADPGLKKALDNLVASGMV